MVSPRLADYFAAEAIDGPRVAVDLELVEARYNTLAAAFRGADIFYAIKANPAPEILDRVAALGGCFDCASIGEIELVLSRGVSPNRISFGNTIKKERVIRQAFEYGVRLFAFDSMAELEKLERSAPGASLFCRILAENDSADWPLSRKFGCSVAMAGDLLIEADRRGMDAYGVSFHVGSQQKNPRAWAQALGDVGRLMARLDAAGVGLRMINLGGGMPATYDNSTPTDLLEYGAVVIAAVREQFGTRPLDLIIEPGRGLVGDAGVIQAEVVLVSKKDDSAAPRWVYLDIGKFNGLAETMDEAIRYKIVTLRDGAPEPVVLAGPTCDSVDVMYEKNPYPMPSDLQPGDKVWILGTGAYTTTYSAVAFNGLPPLESVCI
ncbi:type III PLP-dependent enzyme [Nisaea acidiphila]|uniref:ornithine decarboxylase n=1 Tax=Nisaea acidiphila TaxID=1862145 RepID=A0A9J7B3K4_9PROT|nr:type III PLP-dependent enzyme [Nisaea acidiphila]UUX52205.1 type III PLP-dependent enzyme [Nisaea acidiphila]